MNDLLCIYIAGRTSAIAAVVIGV